MDEVGEMSAKHVAIREIRPSDSDECARIIYEAFGGLHDYHRFPRDFPTLEAASQPANNFIATHEGSWPADFAPTRDPRRVDR